MSQEEKEQKAIARRREWEQQYATDVVAARVRIEAEQRRQDALTEAGDRLRHDLSVKLVNLIESLEPYVDSTAGEVTAGIVAVYLKAVHELGALYGLTRPAALKGGVLPPRLPEPAAVEDSGDAVAVAVKRTLELRAAGLLQLESAKERLDRAAG